MFIPGWPQMYYIAEDGFKVPICLLHIQALALSVCPAPHAHLSLGFSGNLTTLIYNFSTFL